MPAALAGRRAPFPQNRIPISRFDPVAVRFLGLNPYNLPNTAGGFTTTGPINNYIANTHYLADKDGYLGRFDQQISQANKAYFRFAWNRYRVSPGRENILYKFRELDNTTNSYGEPEPVDTLNLTLGDVHTFSPTVINEFRTAYQRRADTQTPILGNQGWAGILGIPGVGSATFPGLVSNSGSSVTWTANPGGLNRVIQDDFEFADNVTKVVGVHAIKFGYQGIRMRENDIASSPALRRIQFQRCGHWSSVHTEHGKFIRFVTSWGSGQRYFHDLADKLLAALVVAPGIRSGRLAGSE